MAGPLLNRRRVVQIGTEAVAAGTEAASYNSMLVFDPKVTSPKDFEKRRPASGFGGNYAATIAEHMGQVTFKFELRGSGDDEAPTEAAMASLLLGAGCVRATDTFTPGSSMTTRKTISVKVYEDGLLKKLLGAAANIKFTGVSAHRVTGEATITGIYSATTDLGSAPTAPSKTPVAPRLAGATFMLDGVTPKIANWTFDLGNDVQPREDITADSGLAHFLVVDRDPSMTLDPEAQLVATYDIFGKLKSGAEVAFSLTLGTTAGNTITFTAPALQYVGIEDAERKGKAVDTVTCQLNSDAGDDEYSIEFA